VWSGRPVILNDILMMETGIVTLLLIVANFIVSYRGFKNYGFFDRYRMEVEKVLLYKDYKRVITSGFLHVGWTHLIFNVISLWAFGGVLESFLGPLPFLLIYFAGLVGGEALSLFVHRNNGSYSSVGASGAIGGVIFASIALFPGMKIGFFLLPIGIPAWIYGFLYVLYSIYGIRSKGDNVGHEAHLGGSLAGMALALMFQPEAISYNLLTIALIAVPSIIFLFLIISRPHLLHTSIGSRKTSDHYSIDHKYNANRADRQKQIDSILDKINQRGYDSLSQREKEVLKEYSQTSHRRRHNG
jgi:membrane associated rhomboid family serine protease